MKKNRREGGVVREERSLITAMIFLFCAALGLLFLFVVFEEYGKATYRYEDLLYKEYSFERVERIPASRSEWQSMVYVREEKKPLLIDVLLTNYELDKALEGIEPGSIISCCVALKTQNKDCAGEIVELKTEKVLISLEEYKGKYRQDVRLGIVFILVNTIFFYINTNKCD